MQLQTNLVWRWRLPLVFLGLIVGLAFISELKLTSEASLNVLFPLTLLKADPIIIDPDNTETTSEYYLLENIAAGLVRDSLNESSGFEGVLSDGWKRSAPDQWRFRIRSGLKYSDGSVVNLQEFASAIENRARSRSRHITLLRHLVSVSAELESNEIVMQFDVPVAEGLLSELSLADAAIITDATRDSGWRKTLAPYFVEKYVAGKLLVLKANPHYPGKVAPNSPPRVNLKFSREENERMSWFESEEVDLFDASAFSFRSRNKKIKGLGYEALFNPPNVIHFLVPNQEYDGGEESARSITAVLVESLRRRCALNETNFAFYDQLIPPGYNGHLSSVERGSHSQSVPASATLALSDEFREWPHFTDCLKTAASLSGCKLALEFFDRFKPHAINRNVVARTYVFKGNQKESLGSWSFLFHKTHGPLRLHLKESGFERMASIEDSAEREAHLRVLHARVLREGWAAPFLIEGPMIFHRQKIGLSRWNPFDLRLRFFDVEML